MKRTTEWRLDTCDCIMHFSWDDSVEVEMREHTEKTIVSACKFHASLNDNDTIVAVIENENIVANQIIATIVENSENLSVPVMNEDGTETRSPDRSKINAKYDDKRNLHIKLSSETAEEKQRIQTIIDGSNFGIATQIR